MYGVMNNSVNFRGNYLIPFNQIKSSDDMRNLGKETSKYITSPNDVMQTREGIVVKIDDKFNEQFVNGASKYGINVQKYEGEFKGVDAELESYSFMVRNLYKNNAVDKIEAFKNMSEDEKSVEYLKVYGEFKNSPYSTERNTKLAKADIKPTGTPIINFSDKNGNKFMAREVVIGNDYECYAIASVDNPAETMLLNKEEFKKLMNEMNS